MIRAIFPVISYLVAGLLSGDTSAVFPRHAHGRDQLQTSNRIRYATVLAAEPNTIERLLQYKPRFGSDQDSNRYQIKTRDLTPSQSVTDNYGSLDNEDRSLLDKFYSETRSEDPFQGKTLVNSQQLWNDHYDEELPDVLIDLSQPTKTSQHPLKKTINHSDWAIDPELLSIVHNEGLMNNSTVFPDVMHSASKIAKYSPIHRLLTTYDPINEKFHISPGANSGRAAQGDRVVGATLYGKDESADPMVSSKSSKQAVRLHDELLREPPRDGIARVRMYFHRAIHDDVKLYGTGPWKYWGHGWGVEYGVDPKNLRSPNFYQKGYSIERAYGRDFCKDKKNCRPPDPSFFQSLPKVGEIAGSNLMK